MKRFYVFFFLPFFFIPATYKITPKNAPISVSKPVVAIPPPDAPQGQIEASTSVLTDRQTLQKYVEEQAADFGINPALADCIVSHESQWVPNKTGPEKIGASQGLWQIYLRMHPDITLAEANDPVWSTHWVLTQIKNGHVSWWSTYSAKPFYCRDIPVFL